MIRMLLLLGTIIRGPAAEAADEYLTRLERLGNSVAIIVAEDDWIILHKAYGFRDMLATMLRLDFERGHVYLQIVWQGSDRRVAVDRVR